MDDFPVGGNGHGAGGIDDPVHVRRGHLAVLDGDDALAVDDLGLAAADPGVHRADFAAGHGFSFFHGAADGLDGVFNVYHHPFAQSATGGRRSQAHDVQLLVPHFAHHGANLGGPDVQTDDEILRHDSILWVCFHPLEGDQRPAGIVEVDAADFGH